MPREEGMLRDNLLADTNVIEKRQHQNKVITSTRITASKMMKLIRTVSYKIHSSSHSISPHVPHNILHDNPTDINSRWSTHFTLSSSSRSGNHLLHRITPSSNTTTTTTTIHNQYGNRSAMSNISTGSSSSSSDGGSGGNSIDQKFIILELERVSIVRMITFGKYHKTHSCNMKEFKVYGCSDESLTEGSEFVLLLHSKLKNDSIPETFPLRHVIRHPEHNAIHFPAKFIKIEALNTWSSHSFPSIWFVRLSGISCRAMIQREQLLFRTFRESENMKSILCHLRQSNELELFGTMLAKCRSKYSPILPNWRFEHEILTQLFHSLVLHGNFSACELLLDQAKAEGLFNWYHSTQIPYTCRWSFIPRGFNGVREVAHPGMRGGHQLCLDSKNGDFVYLIGGWDGKEDLGDFWKFDIRNQVWTCISTNVQKDGGPSPRSCHKTVFDSKRNRIYILGRFSDFSLDTSDFYYYDVSLNRWTLVSQETSLENGPPMTYDHQMVIDAQCENIYVMGGRAFAQQQSTAVTDQSAVGLYVYNIDGNKWARVSILNYDENNEEETSKIKNMNRGKGELEEGHVNGSHPQIKSVVNMFPDRYAHSMCTMNDQSIYIFGGVHQKDHIRELHEFNYRLGTVNQVGVFFNDQRELNEAMSIMNSTGGVLNISGSGASGAGITGSGSNSTAGGSNNATISNSAIFHQQMSACPKNNELFVLSNGWMINNDICATNEMEGGILSSFNSNYNNRNDLWVYDTENDHWSFLCTLQRSSQIDTNHEQELPVPRFASQFVYSEKYDLHFLFGGNAGDLLPPIERLDDFWILQCSKPSIDQVIMRSAKLQLRKQHFLEMCQRQNDNQINSTLEALEYLRANITPLMDSDCETEQHMLQSLTSEIMFNHNKSVSNRTQGSLPEDIFKARMNCFEELSHFWNPAFRSNTFHPIPLLHTYPTLTFK